MLSCLLCSFFLHKCDALLFLHRNQIYFSYTNTKCTIRLVCFSYEEEQFCQQKVQDIKFLLCRKLNTGKVWRCFFEWSGWHVLIFNNMQQHQQPGWSWFQTCRPTVHFIVTCLVAKPLNRSEAMGDLAMIQTLLLFKCNWFCYHAN